MGISSGKLYLADDVRTPSDELLHHRSLVRNARTLDHLVGIEDSLLCMMPFLPLDVVVVKQFLILVLDGSHVRNEHFEPFLLGQNGSSCTALGCS